MNLEQFTKLLAENPTAALQIRLPNGQLVPAHFHITEVGVVRKDFIDCGGTVRATVACVLQAWVAKDVQHRLQAAKLLHILKMAAPLLPDPQVPVEIEYEDGLISQYPLTSGEVGAGEGNAEAVVLQLGYKHTACLALDRCLPGVLQPDDCGAPGCC